jgi:hypothetical protein
MTKTAYFEMCEALKSEPIESEIPIDYEDLALEVQEALNIYSKLKDEWDSMNGSYLGKSYNGISDILTIYDVEQNDRKGLLEIIQVIDRCRAKAIEAKRPKKSNKPPQ